ncbi:MAG TPA: HAMP domain-containing sensor histidine kinase [Sandaracinaceae bacterium]
MTRSARLLARGLGLALAFAALETGALVGLARALEVALAPINAALLLVATSVLGAAWGVRQALGDPRSGSSPCLAAALVPLVACALFVAPRLALGPAAPACATLAAVSLAAPLVDLAWSRWVLPGDDARLPARAALARAAPVLAIGLAGAAATGGLLAPAVGLLLSAGLGTFAFVRARREERDAVAFATWVGSIEVEPDRIACPPAPSLRDPKLRALADEVSHRAGQLAFEAREDAAARAQVADAHELRTRLMASMSHELRSPLNSIVGFAQLLEKGLEGPLRPEQSESVTMIRRSAEELILLLTDILDLARLEAGKLKLARQWTPSVEILTEAVRLGRSIVEGRDVEIEAELQPGLPPVFVDQRRIVQAVVALFRHAASSLTETRIRLRARVAFGPPGPERHLRVEIYDAVGAIPPDEVARIFEAFREITEPTGRRVGGLGMALSLSRELVRLHGGEVWADSAPGAGTILCVAIPLTME